MSTRVLRSHTQSKVNIGEKVLDLEAAPEASAPEPRGRKRTRSMAYEEPEIYNPKYFTKGSGYEGIYDSSDSDSEYEFPVEAELSSYEPESVRSETIDGTVGSEDDEAVGSDEVEETLGSEDSDAEHEYFEADHNLLTKFLTQKIRDKFPDASDEVIGEAIQAVLGDVRGGSIEEYSGAVPKDIAWKADVTLEEIPVLEEELKQLRKNIKDNIPTIPKILKSGLSTGEKQRALQLYDSLNNIEPYTLAYMELAERISIIIKSAPAQLEPEVQKKVDELTVKMNDQTPSIEKITSAKITEREKIRALQLYKGMQHTPNYSEEWFSIQKQINEILKSELESFEEVARVEANEEEMKRGLVSFTTDIKNQIFALDAEPDIKSRLYEMYADMVSRGPGDSQYQDLKAKIIWALKLPYNKKSTSDTRKTPEEIRAICNQTYKVLDENIYGMKEVKIRTVQAVNNKLYNPNARDCLLALKGKPGVGKTRVAQLIAKAAGRPFERINLGGAIDATIFKGANNVWVGSSPSLLLQLICKSKASDTVILLDEIDKLGTNERGIELQHALLHILDPSQNKQFQDAFLTEFNHDISNIWFIPAMNNENNLTKELRDRLDIIEISPYSHEDMIQIMKRHTLPELLANMGIEKDGITISDVGAKRLLTRLGDLVNQTGMRPVEKALSQILSRVNLLRTLYTGDNYDSPIPLDYKLDDFHGLPYQLTERSIDALHIAPEKVHLSYIM